jgi:hypothetical protein
MRRTQVALVLFVFLLVIPQVSELLTGIGWDSIFIILGIVLIGVLVASIAIKHHRTEKSDNKDDGTWNIIPDWQYEGRFAEAGGLTRSEQSEAIEEIQTDAGELERNRK